MFSGGPPVKNAPVKGLSPANQNAVFEVNWSKVAFHTYIGVINIR